MRPASIQPGALTGCSGRWPTPWVGPQVRQGGRRGRRPPLSLAASLLPGALPSSLAADAASLAGLLAFAAAPFLLVQGLADSDAGRRLATDLAARKPALVAAAKAAAAAEARARLGLPSLYGPARSTWPWPGGPAPHLDGTLPGDAGWDPWGLAADKQAGGRRPDAAALARLADLEVLHARWAMLAAVGALVPEAASLAAGAPLAEPRWWAVGYAKLRGGVDLDYLGVPGLRVAGGQGIAAIAASQALLMSGPELARAAGPAGLEPLGIFLPGPQSWPGGPFDPLGLASASAGGAAARLKVAEVKHGRLAMVAWLGLAAQADVGRRGPVADLVWAFGGGEVGKVGL
jgi:light-harvesting complex II chlorophyll a/b binding protein 7